MRPPQKPLPIYYRLTFFVINMAGWAGLAFIGYQFFLEDGIPWIGLLIMFLNIYTVFVASLRFSVFFGRKKFRHFVLFALMPLAVTILYFLGLFLLMRYGEWISPSWLYGVTMFIGILWPLLISMILLVAFKHHLPPPL